MPTNTYSKKSLSVIITLRKGGANNQYVFENCAIHTTIEKTGGAEFAKATVDIYGLTIETMAKLTTLSFQPLRNDWNFIEILAGEQGTTLQSVFKGEITLAYNQTESAYIRDGLTPRKGGQHRRSRFGFRSGSRCASIRAMGSALPV